MSIHEHSRFEIWNAGQHPYRHTLAEFAFTNPAMPGVTNTEGAINWILAVLYPNTKASVATVADLPASGNTINDYRVVKDDGDGKAAGYRWEQREGEVSASWHKIYDMDWGQDSILEAFQNRTDDRYVMRRGYDNIDAAGSPITGLYAGQTIFGGATANKHLTLFANAGDAAGPSTGFIQLGDQVRPLTDNAIDLGTASERFRALRAATGVYVGTLSLTPGLITDSSGAISFDNENLTTTGNLTASTVTGNSLVAKTGSHTMTMTAGSIIDTANAIDFGASVLTTTAAINASSAKIGALNFSNGAITDDSTAISFGATNLSTSGSFAAGVVNVDNLRLDVNTLSTTNANGNLVLAPNGTGVVDVQKALTTLSQTVTGTVAITGLLSIDNLAFDANLIYSTDTNGSITITPNGTGELVAGKLFRPLTDNTLDLGKTALRFKDVYLAGGLKNGTTTVAYSALSGLRAVLFRDAAQSQAAQTGDSLFFDAGSGQWLANKPDTEITHSDLSGLTTGDAGHTQFALLSGRPGGQVIQGDTAALGNLFLESTSNSTKGLVFSKNTFAPATNATYSAGWTGLDLGTTSYYFNNLYMKGQALGLRFENILSSALPAASAQNTGRVFYATDNGKAYVDNGTALKVLGVSKFIADQTFDGIVLLKDVTVSASVTDARNCIWQLLDNANNFETLGVTITRTSATNVRITTNVPLPAGSYRLIGIE